LTLNSFQTSGNSPGAARCRVGILGFGTVGSAIARRLTASDSNSSLQLTHICDRRAREKQARQPQTSSGRPSAPPLVWTDRFDDLLSSDIDVVVEAVGGSEPAVGYVRAALLAGKSVVTSNKLVIAHHGPALLTLAERQGRQLRFEAAVGGAIPIVRAISEGLAGESIVQVEAILNGVANAVLSRMEADGCPVEEAIADACASGYAEADPSEDLDGIDAAAKLAIVCGLAFGVRVLPSQIETRSAGRIGPDAFVDARRRRGTIRQIAHATFDRERRTLSAWVAPIVVPVDSVFGRATGPENAVVIKGSYAGNLTLTGSGAGGDATAVAVIGDVVAIARDRAAIVPAPVLAEPERVLGLTDRQLAEAV
jgi:homoserine dehydrogenase